MQICCVCPSRHGNCIYTKCATVRHQQGTFPGSRNVYEKSWSRCSLGFLGQRGRHATTCLIMATLIHIDPHSHCRFALCGFPRCSKISKLSVKGDRHSLALVHQFFLWKKGGLGDGWPFFAGILQERSKRSKSQTHRFALTVVTWPYFLFLFLNRQGMIS